MVGLQEQVPLVLLVARTVERLSELAVTVDAEAKAALAAPDPVERADPRSRSCITALRRLSPAPSRSPKAPPASRAQADK